MGEKKVGKRKSQGKKEGREGKKRKEAKRSNWRTVPLAMFYEAQETSSGLSP